MTNTQENTLALIDRGAEIEVPKAKPGVTMEIEQPDQTTKEYQTIDLLRQAILAGEVPRSTKIRKVHTDESGIQNRGAWQSVEQAASSVPELRPLYRPIRHYTMRAAAYGALVGTILKALDTTVMLFRADEKVGFAWLIVVLSLAISPKLRFAPIGAILLCAALGIKANLFFTVLGVAFIGTLFGFPLGMIVGTIVGHYKAGTLPLAPDALPEGRRPYWIGIGVPLMALAVIVPVYVWFLIWLVNKMA